MSKKDLSLNKVSELCKKIENENNNTIDELKIGSIETWRKAQLGNPSLSELNYLKDANEKCPSHELPTLTWTDKLGQYPDLKESDVMDVYVFINGLPWQRK